MKNPVKKSLKDLLCPNSTNLFIEDSCLADDKFETRNLLTIVSSAAFMIAGPLFIYFGFYLLTSPLTVKWGSLSIAIGMFVMLFGFSIWQDRQIQIQWRLMKKENEEMKVLLHEILDKME